MLSFNHINHIAKRFAVRRRIGIVKVPSVGPQRPRYEPLWPYGSFRKRLRVEKSSDWTDSALFPVGLVQRGLA